MPKTAKKASSRTKVSATEARAAVLAVKKKTATRKAPPGATWQKGGSNWNRVLGKFGAASSHAAPRAKLGSR